MEKVVSFKNTLGCLTNQEIQGNQGKIREMNFSKKCQGRSKEFH